MKFKKGSIKLYKSKDSKIAFLKAVENTTIPGNSEMVVERYLAGCSPDSQGIVEASKFVRNKGLLVAKSIVDTEKKSQVISILNLDENPVKLKRDDVLATVGRVSQIVRDETQWDDQSGTIPEHLSMLIENTSANLTDEEREKVVEFIREFPDIFVGPDVKVGQTKLVTHKIDIEVDSNDLEGGEAADRRQEPIRSPAPEPDRKQWGTSGMECEVPHCQPLGKFPSFRKYINHWLKVHRKSIPLFKCSIS